MLNHLGVSLVIALLSPVVAMAQVGNRLTVTVDVQVTETPDGFLYEYTLTNAPDSEQHLKFFALIVDARARAQVVGSPEGWTHGVFETRPFIRWASTEGRPRGTPGLGPLPPPPFSIPPGETLGGFRLSSPFPPGQTDFFAEGFFTREVVDDIEDLPAEVQVDWTLRTFRASTTGPVSPSIARCGPSGGDSDGDGICEALDNCRFIPNPNQENSGGVASPSDPSGSLPDVVGDACQCGDANDDGRVNAADVQTLRLALARAEGVPSVGKCNVDGPRSAEGSIVDCDLVDAVILSRAIVFGRSLGVMQSCEAARAQSVTKRH